MRLRRRQTTPAHDPEQTPQERERICKDLESLGVSPDFSVPVAERILELGADLDASSYAGILDGVAVAFDAHRTDCDAIETRAKDLDEIQRLMRGFAGELRKLEEGLRIVSAYVVRMHSKAKGEPGRLLH